MGYEFDWSAVNHPEVWLRAAGITLTYAVGTIICGLILGVVGGMLMLSRFAVVRWIVSGYVQFFRCTPILVQIIWFYYALPILTGYNISSWIAAGVGLTLYMGAFSTEIFRGGVISIDKGQWNAGRALGMNHFQLMRHIILPQATRRMIPPFANQAILQLKNTSLLYVLAVPDLMYSSYQLTARTFRPLETYTFVAILYFLLLYPLTLLAKRLEKANNT